MAIILAHANITVSKVIDIAATYRYYKLVSAGSAAPTVSPTLQTRPPDSTWSDAEPAVDTSKVLYFVDCTVYSDGKISYSAVSKSSSYEAAKVAYNKAVNAENAADEVKTHTIYGVDIEYAQNDSPTTPPTTGWSTDPPLWKNNMYMWQKTVITYGDGTTVGSDPINISGAIGATGSTGNGISSIKEQYYQSDNATFLTGGSWDDLYPGWIDGKYIWTRSVITYTSGSSITTPEICVTGGKGEQGPQGVAGSSIWTTTTAPTTPNYTFTISNLTGGNGTAIKVGDVIKYSYYMYTVSSVSSTTVLASTRVSIRGSTGTGAKWYAGTAITGTSTTATIFSGSGISSAVVGDMYLNTSTSNTYRCTTAGAASAAKWVYVSNIEGEKGDDGQTLYATSSTAAGTAAKVATLSAGSLTLTAGVSVSVKFTYANTAINPTLNISSTGAKAVYTNGSRYAYWSAGQTVLFTYDGTNWQVASTPVYANTVTVGNSAARNVFIDSTHVYVKNGDATMAKFGATSQIGETTSQNVQISPTLGVEIYNNGVLNSYFRDDSIVIGNHSDDVLILFGKNLAMISSDTYTANDGSDYVSTQFQSDNVMVIHSGDDSRLNAGDSSYFKAEVRAATKWRENSNPDYAAVELTAKDSFGDSYMRLRSTGLAMQTSQYDDSGGYTHEIYISGGSFQASAGDIGAQTMGTAYLTNERFMLQFVNYSTNVVSKYYFYETAVEIPRTAALKWQALTTATSKAPFFGYATDQTDGTFVWSITGTNYASGLAIGGGSGNLLYKSKVVLHADNWSSYCAAASHNHSASNITSGTLAVARGGTGVTANPSMLTNLGSTSAASVFAASPRPGVTGTLPLGNGGTGGTTAATARTNLATWMYDLVSNTSYPGLAKPDGTTTGWVRTTQNGLLPYQSGGSGGIGTSSWPFSNGYFTNLYKGGASVATVTWTSYTITPHSNVSASADTTWTCKYNASLGIVYVDGYVEYTPTAAVDAGTSIEIGTMPSALYPADTVALSCAAPSTNSRRWMGSIGASAGAIVVRSSSSLAKGTTYGLHVNAMYVI